MKQTLAQRRLLLSLRVQRPGGLCDSISFAAMYHLGDPQAQQTRLPEVSRTRDRVSPDHSLATRPGGAMVIQPGPTKKFLACQELHIE